MPLRHDQQFIPVWWFGRVHLVDTDDKLLDTEGECKKGVFTSLTILRNTGFELTNTSSDNKYGTIGLRGTSDHVLDEITVTRGIDNCDVELNG